MAKKTKAGKKNKQKAAVVAMFVGIMLGLAILGGVGFYIIRISDGVGELSYVAAATVIDVVPVVPTAIAPEPESEPDACRLLHWPPAGAEPEPEPEEEALEPEPEIEPPPSPYVTITISAAGDNTLGGDSRWAGYHRFMREFYNSGGDHSFFFRNVRQIFYESDLAIVNLEGTLTYAEEHMDKEFVFRGPPHFAKILSEGAVDVVTIANNHTIDFFERGYQDTIEALEAVGLAYFGNEFNTIVEVNGIKVGLFGFRVWNTYQFNKNRIVAAIDDLREQGAQLIIAYHHWGYENVNMANHVQRTMGRFTVESGADLVLGAHPHVIQGIEVYQGVNIVYSLANFSFGGNSNPPDQDTFIFQQTFTFYNGVLLDTNETNIIPVMVSATRAYNNFQPTVAEGEDADRILRRLQTYSEWLG